MKKYKITGWGRLKGALGRNFHIAVEVEAENPFLAILKAGGTYDHLEFAIITDLETGKDYSMDGTTELAGEPTDLVSVRYQKTYGY